MANPDPSDLRSKLLLPGGQPPRPDPDPPDPEPTPQPPPAGGGSVLSRLRLPGQATPPLAPADYPPVTRTPVPGSGVMSGSGVMRSPLARSAPLPPPIDAPPAEDWQAEAVRLKKDNRELKKLLSEMKQILQEASENEQKAAATRGELEAALAAKAKEVEELNAQMQAIEEQIASGELSAAAPVPPTPKTRTELEEWADELEKENARLTQERKRMDSDRYQLREDEAALEKQMREMEVSMARERAQLARQETELKRLSAEIQHELEAMQGGGTSLREQLARFQRRAQDAMQRPDPKGSSSMNLGQPPKR